MHDQRFVPRVVTNHTGLVVVHLAIPFQSGLGPAPRDQGLSYVTHPFLEHDLSEIQRHDQHVRCHTTQKGRYLNIPGHH
jgi:hypothetical protein